MKSLASRVRNGLRQRAEYNRVYSELSAMSQRELDDINVSSGDIREIARSAAYGL